MPVSPTADSGLSDREPTPVGHIKVPGDEYLPAPLVMTSDTTNDDVERYAEGVVGQLDVLTAKQLDGWELHTEDEKTGCKVYTRKVTGSAIPIVRHELTVNAPAEFVLDLYGRINYTKIVDPFSWLLRSVQVIPTASNSVPFGWLVVAETVDDMGLPGDDIARDFCTLDGVDKSRLLQFSKSVHHPAMSPVPSDRVRVPLSYALRTIPSADGKSCTVIQIHHSDSGGRVPPRMMVRGIAVFGIDFFSHLRGLAETAYHAQHLSDESGKSSTVGPHAPDYLTNPLKGGWLREVAEQVPGLEVEAKGDEKKSKIDLMFEPGGRFYKRKSKL